MAILKQEEDDKNKSQGLNNPQDQSQMQNGQVQLSTASAVSEDNATFAAPQAPQNQAPAQANPRASSGSFTNIKAYIDANKGNRIASSASQRLTSATNQANRGISDAQAQFQQRVDTGSLANRGQALQDIQGTIAKVQQVQALPKPPETTLSQPQEQAPQTQAAPAPVQPIQQPAAPTNLIDQETQKRFADIINARYQGPGSLRQAGLFEKASGTVKSTQDLLNQTKTAQSRQDLLRNMFGQNREYSRGQEGLDALLLNTDKAGVQRLVQQGQQAGNLQKALERADLEAGNIATNRATEIAGIRSQARETFAQGQQRINQEIEDRLSNVVEGWNELPNYFKDIIRNKEKNNIAQRDSQLAAIGEVAPEMKAAFDPINRSISSLQNQKNQIDAQRQDAILGNAFGNYGGPSLASIDEQSQALQSQINQLKADPNYQSYIAEANRIKQERDAITKGFNPNALNLSAEEAALLGVGAGEGLYNLGEEAIKSQIADREKLVSRDEQARQFALAQLAGLDTSNLLDTRVKYSDLAKAGTQTAMDALDRNAIRETLNAEEQAFKELAEGANITGTGSKKNKTSGKRYYADETANLAETLKKAGYDFGAANERAVSNEDIRNRIASNLINTEDELGPIDAALAPYDSNASLAEQAGNYYLDTSTGGATALLRGLGVDVGGAISSVFGGGANSAASKSKAKQLARADLQRRLQQTIEDTGFQNRAVVADNEATRQRTEGLRQLLANLDKTNRK